MNQSLSRTVVLLQSSDRRRTVYLNILVFMLEILERNISHGHQFSIYQIALPLRILYLYSCIIYVCHYVIKHVKNTYHFIHMNAICLTNEKIKFCQHKFRKSFKILTNFIICLCNNYIKKVNNICEHNSTRLTNEKAF